MNYIMPDKMAVGALLVFSAYWLWGGWMGWLDLMLGLYLLWTSIGTIDDDDDDSEETRMVLYGA